jgi:hypothetical protein
MMREFLGAVAVLAPAGLWLLAGEALAPAVLAACVAATLGGAATLARAETQPRRRVARLKVSPIARHSGPLLGNHRRAR